jgi:hypothetical protein
MTHGDFVLCEARVEARVQVKLPVSSRLQKEDALPDERPAKTLGSTFREVIPNVVTGCRIT